LISLYAVAGIGGIALLVYLFGRYKESTDPDVELGAVRHSAVLVMTCSVVLGFAYALVILSLGDDRKDPTLGFGPLPRQYSISGRVLDSSGTPVPDALVRATGPLFVPAVARNYETLSTASGDFRLDLAIGGGYNLYVTAAGFEPTFLVSRRELADVTGDLSVPVMLRRRSELQVQVSPVVIGPSQPDENAPYPRSAGITRQDIPILLMSQGIIARPEEIASIEDTLLNGANWTTYLRDGETIYMLTVWFFDEPACRIRFFSAQGVGSTIYIVLRTGGITFEVEETAEEDTVASEVAQVQQLNQSEIPMDDKNGPAAETPTSDAVGGPAPRVTQQNSVVAPVTPLAEVPAKPTAGLTQPVTTASTAATLPAPNPLLQAPLNIAAPPVTVPQVQPVLPPVTVPQVQPVLPPVTLPQVQPVLPPVTVPQVQPVLPPVTVPQVQPVLPPVTVPQVQPVLPPVTVPQLPSVLR
jgi:hypothetical protein